jgi:hypothetical protein
LLTQRHPLLGHGHQNYLVDFLGGNISLPPHAPSFKGGRIGW